MKVESDLINQQSTSSHNDCEVTTISETPSISATASTPCSISTTTQAFSEGNNVVTAKKRSPEDTMFNKRGVKSKKPSTLMEEAVDALKQFCSSDIPSIPSSETEKPSDTASSLAQFVETRLRSLPSEIRKECENDILKVLTKY